MVSELQNDLKVVTLAWTPQATGPKHKIIMNLFVKRRASLLG